MQLQLTRLNTVNKNTAITTTTAVKNKGQPKIESKHHGSTVSIVGGHTQQTNQQRERSAQQPIKSSRSRRTAKKTVQPTRLVKTLFKPDIISELDADWWRRFPGDESVSLLAGSSIPTHNVFNNFQKRIREKTKKNKVLTILMIEDYVTRIHGVFWLQ